MTGMHITILFTANASLKMWARLGHDSAFSAWCSQVHAERGDWADQANSISVSGIHIRVGFFFFIKIQYVTAD